MQPYRSRSNSFVSGSYNCFFFFFLIFYKVSIRQICQASLAWRTNIYPHHDVKELLALNNTSRCGGSHLHNHQKIIGWSFPWRVYARSSIRRQLSRYPMRMDPHPPEEAKINKDASRFPRSHPTQPSSLCSEPIFRPTFLKSMKRKPHQKAKLHSPLFN